MLEDVLTKTCPLWTSSGLEHYSKRCYMYFIIQSVADAVLIIHMNSDVVFTNTEHTLDQLSQIHYLSGSPKYTFFLQMKWGK